MTETIHEKIRKLLALAEGDANDKESGQALAMATRLMMKHGIEADQLRTIEQKAEIVEGERLDFTDVSMIVFSACSTLFVTRGVVGKRDGKQTFYFVGRRDNVEASEMAATHILLQINRLYSEGLPKGMSKSERSKFRKDFKRGAALRVHERVQKIIAEGFSTSGTELVIYDHRNKLDEEIKEHFANKGMGKAKASRMKIRNSAATAAGMVAGDSVDIHRTVKT